MGNKNEGYLGGIMGGESRVESGGGGLTNTGILSLEEAGTQVVGDLTLPQLSWGGITGRSVLTEETPGDNNWNDVTLLLDGTSLTDQSNAGNNVSNAGSVSINQTTTGTGFDVEPKVYDINSSGSQYLYAADGSMDDLGDGAFTIEALVKVANTSTARGIFTTRRPEDTSPNHLSGVGLWVNGSGLLKATINGVDNSSIVHSGTIEDGNWHHVALVYDGTKYEVYLDGTASGSPVTATPIITSNSKVQIGKLYTSSNQFGLDGSVTQVRITKGVARYTQNFTPPTESFPTNAPSGTPGDDNWNDVSLLIRGDTLTDLSGNNTLTNNGAAAGDGEAKYSSGGSLLFDGSNDYLQTTITANNGLLIGQEDLTIEGWFNFDNVAANYVRLWEIGSYQLTGGLLLSTNSTTGRLYFAADATGSGANAIGSTTLSNGVWYHIAVTRQGNTFKLWIDGTEDASFTVSNYNVGATSGQSSIFRVACGQAQNTYVPANFFPGNIEDLRITKGVARYTSNFTPPTESFPTSLPTTSQTLVNTGIFTLEEIYELTKSA